MAKHRVELLTDLESKGLLEQLAREFEVIVEEAGQKEGDLIGEAQRLLALEAEEQSWRIGQEPRADNGLQGEEAKPDRMSIVTESGRRLLPPKTPELVAKRAAVIEAQQKLHAFQDAARDRTLKQKIAEMEATGWFLVDILRRAYAGGSFVDICIFVETATEAIESGTPCTHKQVGLDELNALESQKWEEANQHLEKLSNVHGITQEQINEAGLAANQRIPQEALAEIISAQEKDGWRFTAVVNRSFVFVRNLR